MRICFVCNEYPPGPHGGIGTITQVLARALVKAGHEVRVTGMYRGDYPGPEYEEADGVRVWRWREPTHRLGWLRARYRLYRTLAGWSRHGEIELVDVPDWEGWAAGWPRLAVPVVARLNGSVSYFAAEMGQSAPRVAFWLERASLRRADSWCSASRYTADKTRQLFALNAGPQAVLYNPVALPPGANGLTRSGNKVVFTGTLVAKKGIVSLIRAWPRVHEVCPGAELDVYGKDGWTDQGQSMQGFLRSQLSAPAAASVQFHGHVTRERLYQALCAGRVAVFPSYAEAFAVAPLEAMACGCPTIYSSRGSGPELIRHGQDGLLIDPDRPEEIARAILRILTDDGLAQRLGSSGRRRVQEKFSIEVLRAQNEEFYRRCIRSFARTSRQGGPCSSR